MMSYNEKEIVMNDIYEKTNTSSHEKGTTSKKTLKANIVASCLVALSISVPSLATAAVPEKPDAGTDDCYNRVTNTCNRKHPGSNYGDTVYKNCIDNGLDWCDVNEPVSSTSPLSPQQPSFPSTSGSSNTSVNSNGKFAEGALTPSCFTYPAVAMTPYNESINKYRATHGRVYHEQNKSGSILLYGPVQSWNYYGDGFTFEASYRDPDGSGTGSQVIAQLRFVSDEGIKIIKTLKSNDFAFETPNTQTMSSGMDWSELSQSDGYYTVRMYVQRNNTNLKPVAFGYNLCSAIF